VTVVIDKLDYIQKCEDHLNDNFVYEKVNRDPTKTFKTKINNHLRDLKD